MPDLRDAWGGDPACGTGEATRLILSAAYSAIARMRGVEQSRCVRLLDQIGQTGQALDFTHRAHVAEIARREGPGVQVHHLHRTASGP